MTQELTETILTENIPDITITHERESSRSPHVADIDLYTMQIGNKTLLLKIFLSDRPFARTEIENITGNQPIPGTTTMLYGEAYKLMQKKANALGKSVSYQMKTRNTAMVAWAQDAERGIKVFQWDTIGFNQFGILVAEKSIQPIKSEK